MSGRLSPISVIVMATAGFTLITESLHLKKPYLALPMTGQFEQSINAVFLEKLACGVNMDRIDRKGIETFLTRLPQLEAEAAKLPDFDNQPLLDKIDALLADGAREARWFHLNRKQMNASPVKAV